MKRKRLFNNVFIKNNNGKEYDLFKLIIKEIKMKIAKIVYRNLYNLFFCIVTIISPELNTKMRYKRAFGRKLDLENPQTLNEKVLWLKLHTYYKNPLVVQCADKVAVRDYIKECGCEEILIDIIGVYERAEDIPWEELPDSFVLKWNFGAGMNIVCTNKSEMDKDDVIRQMKKWGKKKYWLPYSEMQYKFCKKRIICERLIGREE